MGRIPSALLVAAVAVLAVAAAVDALRKGAEPVTLSPPQARSAPGSAAAVSALRAAGVTGTLVYSDQDCRLHALRLPALRPAPASRIERCEPHVPTGGIGAFDGDVVWAGLGVGVVQVVVSHEELTRSLRRRGYQAAGGFRARAAVPLAGGRHAVIVEANRQRLLVFLARTRAERVVQGFVGEADSLRPSPGGRYVALFDAGEPGMRVFSANGRELGLPDVTGARAVAWSPDERWTALATAASVFVFASDDPDGALVRIPVAARDLDWEADEMVGAAAALREAGLRGVLTYADADCRLHALTLPDLERHPAPSGRRCRLSGLVALRFGQPVGDPQRVLVARCRSGRVDLSELGGRLLASAPGCSPAWRPDGTLTAVRDGELVSLFPSGVLLGRTDLARELEAGTGEVEIVEAAWLSRTRVAVVVRAGRPGEAPDLLAVFGGRRLAARPAAFGTGMSGLRISPSGRFAAARSSRGGIVLDREGRRVRLPVGVEALSWSQDEEWIAATRGGEIAFFPLGEPSSPGIPLPLGARDLVWR
jgi:hypothetical protein